MASSRPIEVAIIGAGIAGLALALGLEGETHETEHLHIQIYEGAASPRDVAGYALALRPQYVMATETIGTNAALQGRIDKHGPVGKALGQSGSTLLTHTGVQWLASGPGQDQGRLPVMRKYPSCGHHAVNRATFSINMRREWEGRRSGNRVQYGKQLVNIEINEKAVLGQHRYLLHFADGSHHHADMVIGCDGVNSVVRSTVLSSFKGEFSAQPTGGIMLHTTMPRREAEDTFGSDYCAPLSNWSHVGDKCFMMTYWMDNAQTLNVLADWPHDLCPKNIGNATRIEWDRKRARRDLEAFGKFGAKVAGVFDPNDTEDPKLEARTRKTHTQPTPTFVHPHEQICVIGDAAQGFQPYAGAGAGEALLDSLVLSTLLRRACQQAQTQTKEIFLDRHVNRAFHAYDSVRRPVRTQVAEQSEMLSWRQTGRGELGLDLDKWRAAWVQMEDMQMADIMPSEESKVSDMLGEAFARMDGHTYGHGDRRTKFCFAIVLLSCAAATFTFCRLR